MEREEKDLEIARLDGAFRSASLALCADYRGLTVAEVTSLRKGLRQLGVEGSVVKNTLARISAKRVLQDGSLEDRERFYELFKGPTILIFSDGDPTASARVVTKFSKEHEKLAIKGGFFNGTFLDRAGVEELSKMPSREELLQKMLSIFQAPARQILQLLQAPGAQLVRTLAAHLAKLEEQGG